MEEKVGYGRNKRKLCLLLIGLLLCCLLLIGLISFYKSDLKKGLEVSHLLKEYNEDAELFMEMNIVADVGDEKFNTDMKLIRAEIEDKQISCITSQGVTFCFYDNKVFLENGKVYTINTIFPDVSKLLGLTSVLYEEVAVTEVKEEAKKVYRIQISKERTEQLMKFVVPNMDLQVNEVPEMVVEVVAQNDDLVSLEFQTMDSSGNQATELATFSAKMVVEDAENAEAYIPQKVQEVIRNDSYEVAGEFNEDIVRLFYGWTDLNSREALQGEIRIGAVCGPFQIEDRMQLYRVSQNGMQIHCIRKNGKSIFFAGNKICDENGYGITTAEENFIKAGYIPAVIYLLCLNGSFSCVEESGEYVYTFALDEAGMKSIAYGIAPELEEMDIMYEKGSVELRVVGEQIKSMNLLCAGSVEIIGMNAPVSLEGTIDFAPTMTEELTIPQAVLEALSAVK